MERSEGSSIFQKYKNIKFIFSISPSSKIIRLQSSITSGKIIKNKKLNWRWSWITIIQ
jgi:hypothetical protein